ncbi:hypothetical protein TNCV_3485441 [Trichonephila clavipes]|nr:hypothetical protein TNCV_3485441 [Trichonephila clavipes]
MIWKTKLLRINVTSKLLRSVECELLKGSSLLKSLENYFQNFRNEFGKSEQGATDLSGLLFEEEAGQARRQQKRKIISGRSKEVGREFLNVGKIS